MKYRKTAKKMLRGRPWVVEGDFNNIAQANFKKREVEQAVGKDNIIIRVKYRNLYDEDGETVKRWVVESRMISKAMKDTAMPKKVESKNLGYRGEHATRKGRDNIRRREMKYAKMRERMMAEKNHEE